MIRAAPAHITFQVVAYWVLKSVNVCDRNNADRHDKYWSVRDYYCKAKGDEF